MVTLITRPSNPPRDLDSDAESTTSASTTKTFLTSTSAFTAAPSTPTSDPPFWNHPAHSLTRHALPSPDTSAAYLLIHTASRRALSLLNGTPTLVPSPASSSRTTSLGCHHWTLHTARGYLGVRSCASGTFLGRDLPGNIVASAKGHGGWEAFVAVPTAASDAGDGGWVLMCINFVAGCLERVGVREDGGGDGLVILLEGVGEGAVWEFVRVGG